MKGIKEDLKKGYSMCMENNIVKMPVLAYLIYRFNAILIEILLFCGY